MSDTTKQNKLNEWRLFEMKKIEVMVAKDEIMIVGNRYLYGGNSKPMNKGDLLEAYLRKFLNPDDDKWYVKNSESYNIGSDIETSEGEKISVKSGEFSLTEKLYSTEYTESEKQRLITEYSKTVSSNFVAYAWLTDKNDNYYCVNAVIIEMNVFIEFLKKNSVMTIIDTKTKRYKVKVKKAVSTVIRELTRIETDLKNSGG